MSGRVLTAADLTALYDDPGWRGFGYLGERQIALSSGDEDIPPKPELVAEADAWIVDQANARGWSREDLFAWANSKLGRWCGDEWFGNPAEGREARIVKADLMRVPEDD